MVARAPGPREPAALVARLADPDGAGAARVRGGDRQQAVGARADDEQVIARRAARRGRARAARRRAARRTSRRAGRSRRAGAARARARPRSAPARRSRRGPAAVARNCSQSVSCPRRQRRQSPHGAWWWMTTRSPGADGGDARAGPQHLADDLVAEHAGQLPGDVAVADVRAADAAGEHAADDLARRRASGRAAPRRRRRAASWSGRSTPGVAVRRQREQPRDRLRRHRRRDPALGHERRHELGRRDVEGRVAARRVGAPSAARRRRGEPRPCRAPR